MGAPRRFDYDEALARLAAGESRKDVAAAMGVSEKAIYRIQSPRTARNEAKARERYYDRRRVPCEGGCGTLVLGPKVKLGRPRPDGRYLCIACRQHSRRERLRFNRAGVLAAIRCSNIDCANGERWQPPGNFPGGLRFRDVRKKGIHSLCRACNTRLRRQYRARHPESRLRDNAKRMERYYREKVSA